MMRSYTRVEQTFSEKIVDDMTYDVVNFDYNLQHVERNEISAHACFGLIMQTLFCYQILIMQRTVLIIRKHIVDASVLLFMLFLNM
jgi:hypothetical protein